MKGIFRLYLLIVIAVFSIVFSAWRLSLFDNTTFLPEISDISSFMSGPAKEIELVVFGGSWSDSKVYQHSLAAQAEARGNTTVSSQGWAEYLCSQVDCRFRNYASLQTRNISAGYEGTIVENGLHPYSSFQSKINEDGAADLKAQIKLWNQHNNISRSRVFPSNSTPAITIFVLEFGVWDIWQAAIQDMPSAEYIIKASIDILFQALDYLDTIKADSPTNFKGVKAILPLVIDLTFLPGYTKDFQISKNTLELVNSWNRQVAERAEKWEKGELFLYDTNKFMIERIRETQMVSVNSAHGTMEVEKKPPAFEEVSTACIGSQDAGSRNMLCSSPEAFLFWDEVHFGPKAHQLMAREMLKHIQSVESGWI